MPVNISLYHPISAVSGNEKIILEQQSWFAMVRLLSVFKYFHNIISFNSHRWLSGLELLCSCGSVASLYCLMSCVSWDFCFRRGRKSRYPCSWSHLGGNAASFRAQSFSLSFLICKFEIAKQQWIFIEALPDVLKDASIHRDLASQENSRIQPKNERYLSSQAYDSVFSTFRLPTLLAPKSCVLSEPKPRFSLLH